MKLHLPVLKHITSQRGFAPILSLVILIALAFGVAVTLQISKQAQNIRSKAGSATSGTVSVRIYWDRNENGILDTGENNLGPDGSSITRHIRLYRNTSTLMEDVETAADGTVTFANIPFGDNNHYVVWTEHDVAWLAAGRSNNLVTLGNPTGSFDLTANTPEAIVTQGYVPGTVAGAIDTCSMKFFANGPELNAIMHMNPSNSQNLELGVDGVWYHRVSSSGGPGQLAALVNSVVADRVVTGAPGVYDYTAQCRLKHNNAVIYTGQTFAIHANKQSQFAITWTVDGQPVNQPAPVPSSSPTPSISPTVPPDTATPSPSPCNKIGDYNGDCQVTVADLSVFLNDFTAFNSRSDFNNDGNITVADLSIFLSNFGK